MDFIEIKENLDLEMLKLQDSAKSSLLLLEQVQKLITQKKQKNQNKSYDIYLNQLELMKHTLNNIDSVQYITQNKNIVIQQSNIIQSEDNCTQSINIQPLGQITSFVQQQQKSLSKEIKSQQDIQTQSLQTNQNLSLHDDNVDSIIEPNNFSNNSIILEEQNKSLCIQFEQMLDSIQIENQAQKSVALEIQHEVINDEIVNSLLSYQSELSEQIIENQQNLFELQQVSPNNSDQLNTELKSEKMSIEQIKQFLNINNQDVNNLILIQDLYKENVNQSNDTKTEFFICQYEQLLLQLQQSELESQQKLVIQTQIQQRLYIFLQDLTKFEEVLNDFNGISNMIKLVNKPQFRRNNSSIIIKDVIQPQQFSSPKQKFVFKFSPSQDNNILQGQLQYCLWLVNDNKNQQSLPSFLTSEIDQFLEQCQKMSYLENDQIFVLAEINQLIQKLTCGVKTHYFTKTLHQFQLPFSNANWELQNLSFLVLKQIYYNVFNSQFQFERQKANPHDIVNTLSLNQLFVCVDDFVLFLNGRTHQNNIIKKLNKINSNQNTDLKFYSLSNILIQRFQIAKLQQFQEKINTLKVQRIRNKKNTTEFYSQIVILQRIEEMTRDLKDLNSMENNDAQSRIGDEVLKIAQKFNIELVDEQLEKIKFKGNSVQEMEQLV